MPECYLVSAYGEFLPLLMQVSKYLNEVGKLAREGRTLGLRIKKLTSSDKTKKENYVLLKYLVISDIHLGHNTCPTVHIINNLTRELLSDDKKDLDIFFLAGDVFDRLLDFNAEDVQCIDIFIYKFLIFCSENDIKVRILEGTASHDWRQSKNFLKNNQKLNKPCDLVYHTTLTVERMDDYGIHVLYVPDNWINSDQELHREVKKEYLANGIIKADIAIMHGHFRYQSEAMHTSEYSFDESYMMGVVKSLIHIGHFHTHSHYERIVAQGSFDRLKHGEEEPKGYVIASLDTVTSKSEWVFIENANSYVYKTIKITPSMDIAKLDKIMSKYPRDCHIRLAIPSLHLFNITFDKLKFRYCDCFLTKKISDKSDVKTVAHIDTGSDRIVAQFVLNEANLTSRLKEQIIEKNHDFTDKHWALFNSYMKG